MTRRRLTPALLLTGLLAGWLAALVLVYAALGSMTDRHLQRDAVSDTLLSTMLDQENGVRAYLGLGSDRLLKPYREARRAFDEQMQSALDETDDPVLHDALLRQRRVALAWREQATADVRAFEIDEQPYVRALRARDEALGDFRRENARYEELLQRERQREADALLLRTITLVLGGSVLIAGAALLLMRRRTQRERRYVRAQAEFASAMQASIDVAEADALLKRHLERELSGTTVTVLRRDDSGERLEAGTAPPEETPLELALTDARPRDCLAIRRSSPHLREGEDPLVTCEICGASGRTACQPLLVGDRIIGSVLVEYERPAQREDQRVIEDSLAQAAPILSGLRTLALAQSRAMTDALTGLPNRWALEDALKRMLAQAGRTGRPLALALLDLDHFKRLNDTYGHDAGDQALRAVGRALAGTLRDSDLAARSGGEEFAVLLPDTGAEGALAVAEQLRAAVAAIELPLRDVALTASLGVAVLPLHAHDADRLMRVADRALYAAKRSGRNRVEIADAPAGSPPEPSVSVAPL